MNIRYVVKYRPATFKEKLREWWRGEGWVSTMSYMEEVPFGSPEYEKAPFELQMYETIGIVLRYDYVTGREK